MASSSASNLPDSATVSYRASLLATKARWRVDAQSTAVLENAFAAHAYPNRDQRLKLAAVLGASVRAFASNGSVSQYIP